DYRLAAAVVDSPDNRWGHAAAAALAPRVPTIRTGRRPRPRHTNPLLLGFSWVGGGVLGLAIAPLVRCWLFRADPVELGPTVAAYAPWIVPQQFHGRPAAVEPDSEPVIGPTKRRSRDTTAEKKPAPETQGSSEELQTQPSLDEPSRAI